MFAQEKILQICAKKSVNFCFDLSQFPRFCFRFFARVLYEDENDRSARETFCADPNFLGRAAPIIFAIAPSKMTGIFRKFRAGQFRRIYGRNASDIFGAVFFCALRNFPIFTLQFFCADSRSSCSANSAQFFLGRYFCCPIHMRFLPPPHKSRRQAPNERSDLFSQIEIHARHIFREVEEWCGKCVSFLILIF